jgi:membrane protein
VFTTAVVLFLYRVLPCPRPKTREIWPGAVVAALGISVVRVALALYFDHLANFGALYGSLGALMALLIFVYAVSLVLVFGAEYASEWSRLPDSDVSVRTEVRDLLSSARRVLPKK